MSTPVRTKGAARPGVRRPSPGLDLVPDFVLILGLEGVDYRVRTLARESGEEIVRGYRLSPIEPGLSGTVEVIEWADDAPGSATRPGWRNLSCSCPEGRQGGACAHLRGLIRFEMVRPRSPREDWPTWTDEHVWAIETDTARPGE